MGMPLLQSATSVLRQTWGFDLVQLRYLRIPDLQRLAADELICDSPSAEVYGYSLKSLPSCHWLGSISVISSP